MSRYRTGGFHWFYYRGCIPAQWWVDSQMYQTWLKETLSDPSHIHCWLSLGSEAKEEQLLRTDQDNALVFTSSLPAAEVRNLMLPLQKKSMTIHKIGFEYCPAPRWPSNALLSFWWVEIALFYKWVTQPGKGRSWCTIFLIIALVYGNHVLAGELYPIHFFHYLTDMNCFCTVRQECAGNPLPLWASFEKFVEKKWGNTKWVRHQTEGNDAPW